MEFKEIQLRERNKLYPPRFVVAVNGSTTAENSVATFTFQGAIDPIVKEVNLKKGKFIIISYRCILFHYSNYVYKQPHCCCSLIASASAAAPPITSSCFICCSRIAYSSAATPCLCHLWSHTYKYDGHFTGLVSPSKHPTSFNHTHLLGVAMNMIYNITTKCNKMWG